MIWIIAEIVLVIIVAVVSAVLVLRRKQERAAYYQAAYKMRKEAYLDDALKKQGGHRVSQPLRTMLYLKQEKGAREGFVYNPEQVVNIGRAQNGNDLCVRDLNVSSYHCRIFSYGGTLFLEDLGSSNGTWIKRGFRKQQVTQPFPVVSGDRLCIGSQTFKMIVFTFNEMLL